MGEFFKPWRRKIGVVTLALACLFSAGWVRSLYFVDGFESHSSNTYFAIASGFGGIEICWVTAFDESPSTQWFSEKLPLTINGVNELNVNPMLPYWSIVIPLTLLSAWLLFRRPRQRNTPVVPASDKDV